MENKMKFKTGRREFLYKTVASCALCCFAAPRLSGSDKKFHSLMTDQQHKFLLDSGMNLQQVYDFAFRQWYIPAMKSLMSQIGKEKFIEMLKKSSDMVNQSNDRSEVNYDDRTLIKWANNIKDGCKNWNDRLTMEIINDNENVFEIKFTECLWAKTFREANASEIGYAGVCYQDYGMTKNYNPKLNLDRDKTLMQGNDCCHFKWKMS